MRRHPTGSTIPTNAPIQAGLSLRDLMGTAGDSWQESPDLPAESERDDVRRGEANSRHGAVVSQGPMDHLYIDDIEKVSDRRRSAFSDSSTIRPEFDDRAPQVVRAECAMVSGRPGVDRRSVDSEIERRNRTSLYLNV